MKPNKKAPALTPEQQAEILAAKAQAQEEAVKERERVELYGKSVEKMSHRQLAAELRKTIRREHTGRPPVPQAGLTIALASIFSIVLDSTRTSMDKPRPDQINPNGRLYACPR
jgi:hypothetical protein